MADDSYWFDPASADYACRWIETRCVFTEDKWAGTPFRLSPWQRDDIIRPLFGWKRRADNRRRYRRVIVWVPRKNGKTELAAAVSLIALLATGVMAGQVYAIAADKDQARIVFDKAARMVGWSKELTDVVEPLKNALFVPSLQAKFEPMSGTPGGKHGRSASGLIGDEVHEWRDDRLYTFMHQSSAAREEPIEFLISTAGTQEGYGWELWQECQKILDGTIEDPETLVVIYAADPDDDWTDPQIWAKANPNLGVSVRLDYLETECRRAQESPRLENDFKRYHLNLWTEQDVRWLSMELWRKCSERPGDVDYWRELPALMEGRTCYAGIDLSSTMDITADVLWFPPVEEGERWTVIPRFWIPDATVERRSRVDRVPYNIWVDKGMVSATPGRVVDYDYLREQVYADAERYQLRMIGFDKWNATQIMLELEQDGLPVKRLNQGFYTLSPPSKELERLMTGDMIEHGNHPVLTWMARNAGYEQDAAGNIKPSRAKSKEKIDGIAALVNAIECGMSDDGEGGPSVYETRGILEVEL
ncbi:MAG TPA: terminase TerL endonuclease subunit [Bradyrhizobium sp.]|nr:terminase TerL endonuclease subunit [Bradyrhizobium sp.]